MRRRGIVMTGVVLAALTCASVPAADDPALEDARAAALAWLAFADQGNATRRATGE